MAKYDPLRDHLMSQRHKDHVSMTFTEIEDILGDRLPKSAFEHQAWWANEKSGSHTHAKAWLAAGFVVASFRQTETSGSVIFERR